MLPSVFAARLREGDPCTVEGGPGVCKLLTGCPEYTYKLVTEDNVHPVHCAWAQDENKATIEVACCPNDSTTATGVYRDTFTGYRDGVLTSKNIICRYKGEIPFMCCVTNPDPPVAIEPRSCPSIEEYTKSEKQRNDLLWRKCLEYQQYHFPCVSDENTPNKYVRKLDCTQSVLGERISEGTPALEREFPHMALLGCLHEHQVRWVGGGSLISDRYILTAGHVLSHKEYGITRYALLGTTTREVKKGLLYNVVKHIPHTLYNKNEKYNDIALLMLDRPVTMSESIRPICLPMVDVRLGKFRFVSGWGITGVDQELSNELLKTTINILNSSYCVETTDAQLLPYGWKSDIMICAGDAARKGKDTCQADSGGPLQVYMDDLHCTYVIEGIVSFGPTCGKGFPAVYTRVEAYLDWIIKIVWPNE